jgi:hypothetical protein
LEIAEQRTRLDRTGERTDSLDPNSVGGVAVFLNLYAMLRGNARLRNLPAPVFSACPFSLHLRVGLQAIDLQLEQAPQLRQPFVRIGAQAGDPLSDCARGNEENMACDEPRLFFALNAIFLLRKLNQFLNS